MAPVHFAAQKVISVAYDGTNSAQILQIAGRFCPWILISEAGGTLTLRAPTGAGDPDTVAVQGQILILDSTGTIVVADANRFADRFHLLAETE